MALREPEGLREFVETRSPALLRLAILLTGDPQLGEDLLQTALVRVWPHWHRVRHEQPEAYVRRTLINLQNSWSRRRWRGEIPTAFVPDGVGPDHTGAHDERDRLREALLQLPVGQRQVVVLRHVEDRPIADVAAILEVSEGTVKSQCARGLARLRELLERDDRDHRAEAEHVR